MRHVMFDPAERRILLAVQSSVIVAYPADVSGAGRPAIPSSDPRRHVLAALGQGSYSSSRSQLLLAQQVLIDVIAALTPQTHPAFFEALNPSDPRNPSFAGLVLLTDPARAVLMMVEIRQQNLLEAQKAAALIDAALALTTGQDHTDV